MHRIFRLLPTALLIATLPLATSCEKKDKGEETENPEQDGDPLEQLKATPDRIKAEIDVVLAPIGEAEAIMADLEAMPAKFNLSAEDFKGLVKAGFDSETGTIEISADLGVAEEAMADLQAQITALKELKAKLEATPETVKVAVENIAAIGIETTELAVSTLASLTGKAKVAMGDKKAEIEGQIQEVTALKDNLLGELDAAKAEVTELPARAAEIAASFTASFSGSASAEAEG